MITCPPTWTLLQSGEVAVFLPPDPALGPVRYRERVRPPRRLPDLVALALRDVPEFRVLAHGPTEPTRTAEGEYAALMRIDGALGDKPARRYIGAVFAEDMCSLLDVLSVTPERDGEQERGTPGWRYGSGRPRCPRWP